jgi:hypothetical protein
MATGDDIVKVFEQLTELMGEARTERANLRDGVREAKRVIPDMVKREVAELIEALAVDIREDMRHEMRDVIARLERDWRKKLGLKDG